MVAEVSPTGLNWILPQSPSSSRALASTISSFPSSSSYSSRCTTLVCRRYRSALFGTAAPSFSPGLRRTSSVELPNPKPRSIRRSCSASLEPFSDEEFSKKIQELALRFQLDEGDGDSDSVTAEESESEPEETPELLSEPPDWGSGEEITPASIERRANSVELPVSMRMIKRKMQWREGFRDAGESALCSVKKAFSSMVFIIRELHCYSIQMREALFYEDLQGILERVQREMHASFVWLFQQVFSHTPTLMVYVMILLANFTVYSLGHSPAFATPTPTAIVADSREETRFDSSAVKTFSIGGKKTTSIGGGSGSGGGSRPVASGTDGDGAAFHDGESRMTSSEADQETEEAALWDSIVDEAAVMEASARDEALDKETVRNFVSPVSASIDSDESYEEYSKTEIHYQTELAKDPNNPLLLVNYAQFLYVVAHNHDRADEYFKRATKVIPADPAAHSKYATFLWRVKNDLWAAEEAFLEAISAADSGNSAYAADYAHFLWNTGGDDTCYPISDSPEADTDTLST